jgi:hypothetical protein
MPMGIALVLFSVGEAVLLAAVFGLGLVLAVGALFEPQAVTNPRAVNVAKRGNRNDF